MHEVVALLEDVPAKHFESGRPLILRRGQIGTVVMTYGDGALEVEFADREGRAFAILSLRPDQLIVLRDRPDSRSRRTSSRVPLTFFRTEVVNATGPGR